jgi:hypothetical protein
MDVIIRFGSGQLRLLPVRPTLPEIGRRVARFVFAALITFSGQALAHSTQIWFAPMDWFVRPQPGYGGSTDYMALFQEPGDAILAQIDVFKIYFQFASWAADDDLKRVFTELKRHHIALALETGMLTATEQCGDGVEGYGGNDMVKAAARIASLGGDLAYVAMDEPVGGAVVCREDLSHAAQNAAQNLAEVKTIFPGIRVGDIESVGPTPDAAIKWAEAFRAATGEPLAFYHADVLWSASWQAPLEKLAAAIHEREIPFGVIYNGNNDDPSDEAWVANAEAHYRAVEADDKIAPDQVVFQSWVPHPTHLFPDTDPGAFSYLVLRYHRASP